MMNYREKRRRDGRKVQLEALEDRALLSTVGASPTAATNEVYFLYQTLLDRSPAATDVTFWSGELEKGVPPSVVYNEFVNSTEHQGLVTAGTVTGTPLSTGDVDAFNRTFLQDVANANALPTVSGSSLGGTTNVTTYVDSLYTTLLGRAVDPTGETYWVNKINNGASLNSVVEGFLNSTEYQALVTNSTDPFPLDSLTSGDTTAATTFVDTLYAGILRRFADTTGETFWVDRITAGESPNTLITAFLTSPEYINGLTSGTIIP
jgi:hypothetical protein